MRRLAVGCAALWALALLPLACTPETVPEEVIRPVRYTVARVESGDRTRYYTGAAKARIESNLSFRVSGTVEEIGVRVGDRVKPGQLIAELDSGDYELQVKQADATLASAEANARKAAADYKRIQGLYENNNASRSQLDSARAAAEASAAQYRSAEKQLELVRRQLDYTRLIAPRGGSISSVPSEVNENVGAGTPIAVLSSGDEPEVQVSIPESLITSLSEGQEVAVRFDAVPDETFPATVTEVGVAPMPYSTTFPVTVRLNDAESRIRPGMAAEVAFTFASTDDRPRFYLPATAVQEDREGRFVYTLDDHGDGTGATRRAPVVTGELTPDGLEVFEGIGEGDQVVTAGATLLSSGVTVRIPDNPEAF